MSEETAPESVHETKPLEVSVKTFVSPEQLQKDLAFSDLDLSTAMMKQASLFAHYAVLAAQAQKQHDDFKMMSDIKESQIDKSIRDKAAEDGTKLTEVLIAKEVARTKEFVLAQKRVNEARMVADLLKNALEAFKQRRDMLVQVGVSIREEMKGKVTVAGSSDDALRARREAFVEKMSQN